MKTKTAFYTYLEANPPHGHHFWIKYVIACSAPGCRQGSNGGFGRWLLKRNPAEFAKLFTAWQRSLTGATKDRLRGPKTTRPIPRPPLGVSVPPRGQERPDPELALEAVQEGRLIPPERQRVNFHDL